MTIFYYMTYIKGYFDRERIFRWACYFVIGVSIAAALSIAFGCASRPVPVPQTISISRSPQTDLEQAWLDVLAYCTPRLQMYETKAEAQASKAFWMNFSGSVAGVFAAAFIASGWGSPVGLAIEAGLAGWAGTTPFVGESLRQAGLSGDAARETRNGIVREISALAAIAVDGTNTDQERRNAMMGIVGRCAIYPTLVPTAGQ